MLWFPWTLSTMFSYLLFELGCIVWVKYMLWMLDTGRHCICVTGDQFWTVFVTTNFIFVFSSCNPCNSSLHSSFQWLDLNVMGKRNDNDEATIFLINHQPDTRVKLSLVKHNLFYLQTTQKRKDGWWVHSWENYSCWDLHFQTHKELVFFLGGGWGGGG